MVSPSQRRCLEELVRDGADNHVIGERLNIRYATVKYYMHELMQATNTHNRTALALWWIREGRYAENPAPKLRIAA
jgi:DNA-binding NarL/FixJ family response regulator